MALNKVLEQHIAVFGESGSGKTVLVSSFYGAMQEPQFLKDSLFDLTADDPGQGHRLHRNYLGMKDSARRPETTRFSSTPYGFSVKLREPSTKASDAKSFDTLRLVWHDYPGEWFEQEVSGPEEAQRRVATFRSLLRSDVALLLVDGQRLLDNAGEEERYLKSLLGSFRTGLLGVKDHLAEDGGPIVRFPRIWILALSKADLLPSMDVFAFRDLMVGKAADDLAELRRVIEGLVKSPEALALGEDYVIVSSAKFQPDSIEVGQRIGLELVLPIASVLSFERHIRWAEQKQMAAAVVGDLLQNAGTFASLIFGKDLGPLSRFATSNAGRTASRLVGERLRIGNVAARERHDRMAAVLSKFRLDLENGEEDRVLLRSRR